VLIGAHASVVVGRPRAEGEALLADLLARATGSDAIHSHRWSEGDVVIWDNRSVLHRATAYDASRHRRLMQRTTIGNPGILETPPYRRVAALRDGAGAA
jgi:alpha-ketoglutarate-dependent 2,4-dichlorophenoxyacetate dioxygenase